MKKRYISPEQTLVELSSVSMLATSIEMGGRADGNFQELSNGKDADIWGSNEANWE